MSYCEKFLESRTLCKVAAFNLTPLDTSKYPREVAWEIDQNSKKGYIQLAKKINEDAEITGIIIQHEYGIFGGVEGNRILHFMHNCKKPILVTLHTILPFPQQKMREVTRDIVTLANTIVVLTKSSQTILEQLYPESIGKVHVVPHGIHPTVFSTENKYKSKLELNKRIVLSTFGLLSRGKGIEYMIKALPAVIKKYPSVLYLILGETHPVIRRNEGEKYRIELIKLVKKLGLQKHVKFYDQYLKLPDLFAFLKATDIYISTSTNPNQAVSGTLSYALGSGRAVISTQFAQAKEIVTTDVGRLVPIKNSQALTEALLDLLSDNKRLEQMHHNAYNKTRNMLWSNVAKQYISILTQISIPPLKLDHLRRMTDEFGLFQFASHTTPNKYFGYTLDDNARALILCSWLIRQKHTKELENLITIYFNFMKKCFQKDGSFINYIGFTDKLPTSQNKSENLEDVQGRALWALGEIMENKILTTSMRSEGKKMFLQAFKKGPKLTYLRSKAFAIKAFGLAVNALPEHRRELVIRTKEYADALLHSLSQHGSQPWMWFENQLVYSNGLLPESLLIAGEITRQAEYITKGMLTLNFLIDTTFSSDMYHPIGNSQWYINNQKRSDYDQQAEDPASMICALTQAYKATQDKEYIALAKKCFSWFLGNNSLGKPLYDGQSGGCHDGLRPSAVNSDQGAESLLSYLMASSTIQSSINIQ